VLGGRFVWVVADTLETGWPPGRVGPVVGRAVWWAGFGRRPGKVVRSGRIDGGAGGAGGAPRRRECRDPAHRFARPAPPHARASTHPPWTALTPARQDLGRT